jgi:electron transfer flavoprotein beta subunit
LRILVFLGVGADTRIPPQLDPRSGRVREEWLVREIDPAAACALDLALDLAAGRGDGEATVFHLGPPSNESFLHWAVARGCRRAIRIWDEEAAEARTAGKALVLAAAARAAGFDLILTGDQSAVAAGGQLGVLVAEHLGLPCVTRMSEATFSDDGQRLEIARELEGGFRERVEATLPVVATVPAGGALAGGAASPVVSARELLVSSQQEIPVWTLADLGVPAGGVRRADAPLRYGLPRPRRPRLHPLPVPDPTLPAFDRILKLVQGSVSRREGRVVRRPAEEVAQEVFEVLRDEGWLDHLRLAGGREGTAAPAPEAG